jgi:hypothetical protein
MSFYLVLNLGTAPKDYEQFRIFGVSQGLIMLSTSGEKLVTVWTASTNERRNAQLATLEANNIEVIVTSGIHDTGFAIEKFMT